MPTHRESLCLLSLTYATAPAGSSLARRASEPASSSSGQPTASALRRQSSSFAGREAVLNTAGSVQWNLPEFLDYLQQTEPAADDEGLEFYTTAHDSFLFDDPALDFATSVAPSDMSSPPSSTDGDCHDHASLGSSSRSLTPKMRWWVRKKLRHLVSGCVSGGQPVVGSSEQQASTPKGSP